MMKRRMRQRKRKKRGNLEGTNWEKKQRQNDPEQDVAYQEEDEQVGVRRTGRAADEVQRRWRGKEERDGDEKDEQNEDEDEEKKIED